LGNKFKKVINDYDFMRRKRHRFIYEPDIPCSRKEAEDVLKTAGEFIDPNLSYSPTTRINQGKSQLLVLSMPYRAIPVGVLDLRAPR